jgi:hypothetical protein
MLRGVFRRAAVAILLMGTMLAPIGTCLQRTHKSAHSCCAPAPESDKAFQSNCCTVRTPLPAVVVAPSLPPSSPLAVTTEYIASGANSAPSAFSGSALTLPQSPPPGIFILRI